MNVLFPIEPLLILIVVIGVVTPSVVHPIKSYPTLVGLFNDKNVVVKENEDGTYSLIADDKEVIFDKDSTLAEAVTKANSELNNGKPVQAIDSPEATRGLSELTNSEYSIYINIGNC